LILGTTSFGKGSVQAVEPLRDGSGLKLTIARYYTPNGNTIQAQGIKPDVVVKERFVKEEIEEEERHRVQEKDLKNHISAKPENETKKDQKSKSFRGAKLPGEKPSEMVSILLTQDNQTIRALEILTSWQILSKLKM
jgi:carboxyl-terminal processing protease